MELKNGPLSVFRLVGYSLKTANQSFGACLLAVIITFLLCALLMGIMFLSVRINPMFPIILQIPLSLIMAFLAVNFQLGVLHIVYSKIEKTGCTVMDSLKLAIVPSFYYIIASLLLAAPIIFILLLSVFSGSKMTFLCVYAVMCLLVFPIWLFLPTALVIRQLGPIESLKYAWDLGKAFYLRIVFTILAVIIGCAVIALAVICLLKAFAPAWIDFFLSMANNTDKAAFALPAATAAYSLPLLILGFVFYVIFYFFFFVASQAFITILFLNLDYTLNGNLSMPTLSPISPDDISAIPTEALPVEQQEEITVEQEAIHTESINEDTVRQLSEVYNPQEHLDQAVDQEEDRMPTILFDEEMLKQFEENERQMRERKERAKQQDDDTPDSIKMSDKTL